MLIKKKVYTYLTYEGKPLLFSHLDFSKAGLQVPGGSVEIEEDLDIAIMREALEETGLTKIRFVRKLGSVNRDMRAFDMDEIHERHYFHLKPDSFPGETWIAYENNPLDGSEGPIAFRFFWGGLRRCSTAFGRDGRIADKAALG